MQDSTGAKLKTLPQLKLLIEELRACGRVVVFANGCFDLLHVGHIRYLQGARAEGDVLVVGVNGDESVRALKGRGRPLLPARERAEIVASLECVDFLLIFEALTVDEILLALRPHVHAKGTDYTEASVPEGATVRSFGGRVAIVGDSKHHSTSGLIRTLLSERMHE